MKKLKLIASVIFVLTLLAALAVGVSAKWWEENPYEDVKSDAWYYDAVRICRENGIFNGTSETAFGTGVKLTRAQFVTALAGAAGYDKAAYSGASPFGDVPADKWYSAPVAWAAEKGITSGTGNGLFAPGKVISREELVTMLRRYAEINGYPTGAGETPLDSFPDIGSVSGWAKNAIVWAYEKGIVSGSRAGDKVYLAPKATATREQAAQMMVRLLGTRPVREINGNDLSLYRIVCGDANYKNDDDSVYKAGLRLQGYIKSCFGLDLPFVSDSEEPTEYEILLGKTNREQTGLVTVDRDAFENDQQFICQVQGNRLVICGVDSTTDGGTQENKKYNVKGTRNAVFYFGENVLGVETYSESNGGIYKYNPDPIISLPDGWTYIDGPYFRKRRFFMSGGILGTDSYMSDLTYCMSTWLDGDFSKEMELIHDDTPCLTNEDNIAKITANVKAAIAAKPKIGYVGIGINDSAGYCHCENCSAAYRKYKSLSATLCLLVNHLCEECETDFPNVKFLFGAYTYTVEPPTGIVMHDNAIVEYYTIDACYGHAYTDTNCKLNKAIKAQVDGWNAITKEMWLWDHCGNFQLTMTPVPDWDSMLENIRFFADSGATEVLMNSVMGGGNHYSDFGYLRGYMFSRLYMDPYMSAEEFDYRLNKGLEAYYGAGWKNIREYIDTIAMLGNSKDHRHHAGPVSYYDYAEVREAADRLDGLWANAFEKAAGDEIITERLTLANHSWIFLRQCATWETRYKNGTDEQRAAYVAANEELCSYIFDHGIIWTEGTLDDLDQYDPTMSPENW